MGEFFNWQPHIKGEMKEGTGTLQERLEEYLEKNGFIHKIIVDSATKQEEPTYDEVKEITEDEWTAYWLSDKRKIFFMFRLERDATAVRLRW